jgi:hypothetical protein
MSRETNQQRSSERVRRFGISATGLFPKHKRSWKGPTRFFPRCRKGHPVDYDMARCFKCSPLPKGRQLAKLKAPVELPATTTGRIE